MTLGSTISSGSESPPQFNRPNRSKVSNDNNLPDDCLNLRIKTGGRLSKKNSSKSKNRQYDSLHSAQLND